MVCGGAATVPYWPGGEPTMSIATQLAGAALRLKAGPPLEQGWRLSYWSHLSTRVARPAYGRESTAVGRRDGDLYSDERVEAWQLLLSPLVLDTAGAAAAQPQTARQSMGGTPGGVVLSPAGFVRISGRIAGTQSPHVPLGEAL